MSLFKFLATAKFAMLFGFSLQTELKVQGVSCTDPEYYHSEEQYSKCRNDCDCDGQRKCNKGIGTKYCYGIARVSINSPYLMNSC